MDTMKALMESVDALVAEADEKLYKCHVFSEASDIEYKNNLLDAQLKMISESGTDEDMAFMEAEAKEGLIARGKTAVTAMINTIVEFFKKLIEAVSNFFDSKTTKDTLDKAETALKKSGKGSTKIKILSPEKVEAASDEYDAQLQKVLAKAEAGVATEEDMAGIAKAKSKRDTAIKAATVTISIAGAIGLLKAFGPKFKTKAGEAKEALENAAKNATGKMTDDNHKKILTIISERIQNAKSSKTKILNAMKEAVQKAGAMIRGEGKLPAEPIGGSDEGDGVGESVSESSLDAYLDNMIAEISAS